LEFPEAYVKTLPRLDFSDHHPIIICPAGNVIKKSARLFRFESAWHLNPSYRDMLQASWLNEESVTSNLNKLQQNIKEWKFCIIDQIMHKKRRLMARIEGVQDKIVSRNSDNYLRRREQKLQGELAEILEQEELLWFQRSRAK
jgi:hypothetical protein